MIFKYNKTEFMEMCYGEHLSVIQIDCLNAYTNTLHSLPPPSQSPTNTENSSFQPHFFIFHFIVTHLWLIQMGFDRTNKIHKIIINVNKAQIPFCVSYLLLFKINSLIWMCVSDFWRRKLKNNKNYKPILFQTVAKGFYLLFLL